MADLSTLRESCEAHEAALKSVQIAMHQEENPAARRELILTWGRLAEKAERLRNRINEAMRLGWS